MSLIERDQKIIWHPFTQQKIAELPIAIKKAQGSYLYDINDKPYLDLISSWWVNLHGHAHPTIAQAIYEQALNLEHVIFAGFTHEPAVMLCESLREILPETLTKFFFSDNGSTSVEIALKMAYQYWLNKNQPQRNLFISFEGGYHGDTFGAMAVGATSGYHNPFQNFLFKVLNISFPATWEGDIDIEHKEDLALEQLKSHLKQFKQNIAAIILEPLVQGASGMRMCRPLFLQEVLTIIRQHDILIIYDEVMTGFGRTGTNFALDKIDFMPDFLCLSKGLTGGFLPLALTITTEKIFDEFLNQESKYAFAHGHSYTANPIACAAAITSLKLLLLPETISSIQAINKAHTKGIKNLKQSGAKIQNSRVLGTIAAFEVNNKKVNLDLNKILKTNFLKQGILLRPLGNTIYLLPPYSITSEELEFAYRVINTILLDLD